ncbi:MAG: exodeoxyribonuclease VII large subunit [Actinomycetota bacterium]|nr:exodeoxyribonuclease VII large subunit [Actinomycetota bacterium]
MTAPSTADHPWPVRTVSRKLTDWIGRLGEVWVEGQVAQISRRPGAATVFLVLRDPAADMSLSVTCRRELIETLPVPLADGARIIVRARADFYPARGTLSLRASDIRAVGIGDLLARIERLRQLLAAEGLFDVGRKKPLPFLPVVVGLVTGRGSAAEHDVVENARRRWPAVLFATHACAVQGPTAARSVIDGLHLLDRDPDVTVIVIARGGGSVEDLLPFSDEGLCRAVAACRTPVVSAIGHESDSALIDYVADVRASTPTDAGLRVVPDLAAEQAGLARSRHAAYSSLSRRVAHEVQWLTGIRRHRALGDPESLLEDRWQAMQALRARARRQLASQLAQGQVDLDHTRARIVALSPAATLSRGYAVVTADGGEVVREPAAVSDGQRLHIRVAGGSLQARAASPTGRAASPTAGAASPTGRARATTAVPDRQWPK